ncbi:MAG: efflux RND transporter periplasmic adaptor subunit [Clostridia bacterium]|nr:efflux RND transporter periplasmic adaptor subunit [Clostridia bacterium]
MTRRTKKEIKRASAAMALTMAIIGGMVWYGQGRAANLPTAEIVTVTEQTLKETVACSGTIQPLGGTDVMCTVPCVAGDIPVSTGDTVHAGDALVYIDKKATLAAAVSAGMGDVSSQIPTAVTAPVDGVIREQTVRQGEWIDPATPCFVIGGTDEVNVSIAVRENVLPRLQVGQTVTVTGPAFQKKRYRGVLSSIASSAHTGLVGSGTETVVDAAVTFLSGEADASLIPGLTAKATVLTGEKENVLFLPFDCVAETETGERYVYVLEGESACRRVVKAIDRASGVEIEEGLQKGERIVTAPEQLTGERVHVLVKSGEDTR